MTSYESIMRSINPAFLPTAEQRAVIESTSPSILVVAGAGSGKTATMANRIAYQVACGNAQPGEVLGLTFTRKAAGELAQRVERALAAVRRSGFLAENARSMLARPHISTYNAFASHIAQSHGMLVGVDPLARVITEAERWQLMEEAFAITPVDEDVLSVASKDGIIKNCLTLAAGLLDNDVSPDGMREFLAQQRAALARLNNDPQQFKDMKEVSSDWNNKVKKNSDSVFAVREACLPIVESYFELKRDRGLIEFADQVAVASKVLRAYPQIGREISGDYRLVLLDEYQDTSSNQAEFLKLALATRDDGRSVCAVGDPNQAIYGWRGASANALADFAVQFGPGTERLSLSTSFRSDEAILSAANAVAQGLTNEGIEVGELSARQGAGPGRVTLARPFLREDSYRAIAWRIRDIFRQTYERQSRGDGDRPPEVAVLCRKRAYFEPMIHALREHGIPYEIGGGASLVLRQEIVTVRSALGVVAMPSRNDLLLRLLAVWAVGVGDLRALHSWARELARRSSGRGEGDGRGSAGSGSRASGEQRRPRDEHAALREEVSLVEAVTELPPASWRDSSGLSFSQEGRRRLETISSILAHLRQAVHLPLAELIASGITQLGLDVAAATRTEGSQRVKTSLDSFIALGREFQESHPGQGLAEFLAWLDLVEEHEYGGEEEAGGDEIEAEVHPGVVQIMTVHAAKGLEWRDLVAVPEMVVPQSRIITWLSSARIFPPPLRKDVRHLPSFQPSDYGDKIEAGQEYHTYLRESLPAHESREARRLAYVAFTRPSAELLLASYGVDGDKERKKDKPQKKLTDSGMVALTEPSVFVRDVREVAVPIAQVAGDDWPSELLYQCPEEMPAHEWQSLMDGSRNDGRDDTVVWPGGVSRDLPMHRALSPATRAGDDWQAAVELVIRERKERLGDRTIARPYVTATDVVHIADDPEAYLRDLRRPVPQRPSRLARTGTQLHARIAGFYERPATLDLDAVLVPGQQPVDQDVITRPEERRLYAAFEASRWAHFPPIAIEESLTVVIGGRVVRCKIDAVLDTSAADDLPDVTIVDWKTGSRPASGQIAARELQLALYRLAWAKTRGVPVESIGSCFVYLRDGEVLMAGQLSEEEVTARIAEGGLPEDAR